MQKKAMVSLWIVSIMLMSMNCLASRMGSDSPTTLELELEEEDQVAAESDTSDQLDLYIPIPQHNMITLGNGQPVFYYSIQDFKLVLKIFETYNRLGQVLPLVAQQMQLMEEETSIVYEGLNKCNATLNVVDQERQELHLLREKEFKIQKQEMRKEKIKAILIGAGAGIVGVAGGILIGFFGMH